MKIIPFIIALATVFGANTSAWAQNTAPLKSKDNQDVSEKEKKEQALLEKYLKVISDPNADYQTKSNASDAAFELSPYRYNEVGRAGLLQNDPYFAGEALNGLLFIDEDGSQPFRAANFKFIQENIASVQPQVQSFVLGYLIPTTGIQTREYEGVYHQIAKSIVEQNLKKDELLSDEESEAISKGCLLLSLSRFYDATDGALMIRAASVSKSSTYLALALSNRKLLTKPLLQSLKEKDTDLPKENAVMRVVVAQVDESAQENLIRQITVSINAKRATVYPKFDMDIYVTASFVELLRFLNFPEKKDLIVATSKSIHPVIKKSALLVAAEDYPDIVLNNRASIETFFTTDKASSYENYAMLLTYLSLRHPAYAEKIQNILGSDIYDKTTKDLRYTGLTLYNWSEGFNGL